MGMKFMLIAALVVPILLLGCTISPPQPAAQQQLAQNPPAIGERTGAGVENAAAQPQPQAGRTCALTLNPSTIYAGSSTEVGFAVQSGQKVVFTYNCGKEILEISSGGLTTGYRLCQFDPPGSVDVWIKADGTVCAQKTLLVQQPVARQAAKACSIDQSSVKRDLASYYYEARVQFSGFAPEDEIVWVCDYTTTRQKLGGGGAMGMPLYSEIYCDFAGRPKNSTIEVSVGGVSCGGISTR